MAKLGTVEVNILNFNSVKATLCLFKEMLSDERIDFKLREEYAERYDNLLKQLEFDEYCENASESHSGLEW